MADNRYIETEIEVKTFIDQLKYALETGAEIVFQEDRVVDQGRNLKYTNRYTIASLFPNEDPKEVLKRELKSLDVKDYIGTVKDLRFPKKGPMREFGKTYNNIEEVYIKVRVTLMGALGAGRHTTFVMSFHFAEKPFSKEVFPYK